jgi:large subunit ribosomal protein L4e
MKVDIVTKDKEKKGNIEVPKQFTEDLREDIIKRVFESESSKSRQKYGASDEAGMRHSTYVSKRRHKYRGTYGIGQSRTPRKVTSRSGSRMNWVGAFAPQTVGGRRAHPPKAEKNWGKKINTKEMNLAFRSAISATLSKETIESRGQTVPEGFPFIIDESIEKISKTKEMHDIIKKLGLILEIKKEKKIRAGKGKSRGRKYKTKIGLLIVSAEDCRLNKSGKNLGGVDVKKVDELKLKDLAPGAVPGRITLWTKNAIEKMQKEKLYM